MLYKTATRFAFLSPLLSALLLVQPINGAAFPSPAEASANTSLLLPAAHVSLAPVVAAAPSPASASPAPAVKNPRAVHSVLRSSHASFFLAGAAQPGTPADPTDTYILAEASALKNDPNAIFAFVRDQVANQVYSGSLRGARGALWTMGGNSLDKASLLIALLGAAGIQAQYAQGTLGATAAANAILTMFPSPTIVAGCIPPGTTLASPQTDATLLATAANHYWVQYGANNTAADPSIPGASLGQSFATPTQTFTSIPAALKQMVTITLIVETYSALGQFGTTPELVESYETDLLSGRPISFGTTLSETITPSSLFSSGSTAFTYTPYLLLGQADSNIEQDPVVQGTAFTETYSNILFSSYVSGLFLQIQAPDSTGTMQTYQHTILDRVGYANRQSSPLPSPNIPTSPTPAIIPAQIVTMDILPGLQAQDSMTFTNQKTRINNEQTSLSALQPQLASLPTSGALTSTQQALVNSVILAEDDLEIALGELAALSFAATADRILSQTELEYRSVAYYTSPRLILVSTSPTGTFSFDLLKRDIQVIASPGQNVGVPVWFEETRGMIESSSEASVLSTTLGQTSYDITSVFAAANGNFIALSPWVVGQTMPNLSADSVARIQTALANNKFVIAPATTPIVNGAPLEGWIETDINTGETVSTFANGYHQGIGEYDATLLSSLFGKKSSIIGLVSGAGLTGYSFMAGVLNGVAAFAATGKETKGKVVCVAGTSDCSSAPLAQYVIQQFNALNTAIKNIDPSKVCVPKIGCNDAQKSILSALASGMDVGAGYSEEILLRALPADPEIVPFLSTNIAPAPATITPGTNPGVNLAINLDQYFTAPTTNGTEVPTIFVANIQNTGPATDTFNLTFGSVPGYQVESSLNSVTIPAGQTAQVGVCLVPTGPTAPATTLTANVGSATNKSVTSSSTTGVNGGTVGISETIQTSPAGLQVSIDGGNPQTAPVSVTWKAGSQHTIAAASPQGSNGTQYAFTSWSDNGALSHNVTAVSSVTTYTATFSTAYQLTTSASPSADGAVSPATGSYYASGTVVNLSATPNSGYKFSSWTGSVASSTAASTSVTMNSPQTVTANFVTNNSSFTINTVPSGLQVSIDGGAAQVAPVSVSWQLGSQHTIATTSPQGSNGTQYNFTSWSDSGALSHSVTAVSTVTTYTANFSTSYQLTTSANPSADGTVSPASGSYYPAGTVVNLTATPNSGYKFSSWTGNVASSTSASTSITMNSPQTVTANFAVNNSNITIKTVPSGLQVSIDGGAAQVAPVSVSWQLGSQHTIATTSPQGSNGTQYTFANWSDSGALSHTVTASSSVPSYTASFTTSYQLTTSASPSADGAVSPVSGSYYPVGTVVNLTATPNSGYKFSSWSGSVASSTSASTSITMSSPQTVTANFAVNNSNITINTVPSGLQVSIDNGAPQASPVGVSWQLGSQHTIATTSPQGSNGTQYTFANWSDSGALSHTVTATTTVPSYTASFNTSYQLTTSATPSADGTVSPATGSYYPSGTVVNLTATPNSGYKFGSWTGSVASSTSASTSVTMNSPQTVAANFTAAYTNVTGSMQITATAFFYNRATKTFNTTYTITNTGASVIAGPLELVLTGLSSAVTVANVTGTFQNNPFMSASSTGLAPGTSVSVAVQFSDPTNAAIQATPVVYSGVL